MISEYDVFNGDADGICALHQLRMAQPAPKASLVTGVKRDIKLLQRLEELENTSITVLDISLDSNRDSLIQLLDRNNTVFYIDHHFAGDIPKHQKLTTQIDPSPETCTSLLINALLGNKFPFWAVCGAFGDNLHKSAVALVETLQISDEQISILREIGELLNYNGYGASINDLHFAPDDLYKEVSNYQDPFDFYHQSHTLKQLQDGYKSDMENALTQKPLFPNQKNRVYELPDLPWARRVSGVFANLKAREQEQSAHALLTKNSDQSWRISVRAPLADRINADQLCKQFPTGGGRAAAAGINSLPDSMLDTFLEAFSKTYP